MRTASEISTEPSQFASPRVLAVTEDVEDVVVSETVVVVLGCVVAVDVGSTGVMPSVIEQYAGLAL